MLIDDIYNGLSYLLEKKTNNGSTILIILNNLYDRISIIFNTIKYFK